MTDRTPVAGGGPVIWLNVAAIDATLALVEGHGGQILAPPSSDQGVRWLATIADPAGNTVGLAQHGPR